MKGVEVTKSFQSQIPKMKSKILVITKLIIKSYTCLVVGYETSCTLREVDQRYFDNYNSLNCF